MTISAIIPVWNGEAYVAEAIRSVLSQTLQVDEIIVVDDGSTDHTADIVRSFANVRLIQQENASPGPARNTGVRASSGDWLAFLDHDDLWLPEKIETQIRMALGHPESVAVLGLVQNFISPDLSADAQARIECPANPLKGYTPSALTIRREAFLKSGGWPNSERQGVEWFAHALATGVSFLEIPRVLTMRRLHQTNRTRLRAAYNQDYARIARGMLAMRRANQGTG